MSLSNVFYYLKKHGYSKLIFDPNQTDLRDKYILSVYWSELYQGPKESITTNAPDPGGNIVKLNLFVNVSHADNMVTRG